MEYSQKGTYSICKKCKIKLLGSFFLLLERRKINNISYLKKLHFLPVRYRIQFKICLLGYKCMNNLAPEYLQSLVSVRQCNNQRLRINEDYFRLSVPPKPNLTRTSF